MVCFALVALVEAKTKLLLNVVESYEFNLKKIKVY